MLMFLEKILLCFLPFLFGKALDSLLQNDLHSYFAICLLFVLYFLLKSFNQYLEIYHPIGEIKQATLYFLTTVILGVFSFLYFHWTSIFAFFFIGMILNIFLIFKKMKPKYQLDLFAGNLFNASYFLTITISFWFMLKDQLNLNYCITSLMVTYIFSRVFVNKAIFNKIV